MTFKRPTILDVASMAGVSKSTVSLVLRESPLVKDETAKVVRLAMRDLGYVYNRAAANLRSTSKGLIGLVINDLRNPFFTEFAISVQMELARRGYAIVIANTDEDPKLQEQVIGSMVEHGVSAFLISPAYGGDPSSLSKIEAAGIPAMQVFRHLDRRTDIFPFASLDNKRGGELATRHLIDMGAQNIAFVGGIEGHSVTTERMSGYLKVIAENDRQPLPFHGRATRAFGRETAQRIASEHPEIDAFFAFNDLIALGMMAGFSEIGRAAGRDYRLVGFDDIEDCAQVWPQLTSVRCNIARFGRFTATTMLNWIEGGIHPAPEIRADVELAPRGSSLGI